MKKIESTKRIWQKISGRKNIYHLIVVPAKPGLKPKDMKNIKNQLEELGYLD